MDIVAEETSGKSYRTYKYSYDRIGIPAIDYDDDSDRFMQWKNCGESERLVKSRNVKLLADRIINQDSIFKYFLDGSRRVFKVDDIVYEKQVYPVIAGQIGVGCCKRINRRVVPEKFDRKFVLALPTKSYADSWQADTFYDALISKLNDSEVVKKIGINFEKILRYKSKAEHGEKLEDFAISAIQEYMIESEKEMVAWLVKNKMLGQYSYLIKDGSLEYKEMKSGRKDLRSLQKIKNNYNWVVGISKKFNPECCLDYKGQRNSNYIADLPLYHRTPVARYMSPVSGDVNFGVWYLRIRDKSRTNTPFDGVIKIEKLLMDNEIENGINTDDVDLISANLVNERIPTCYGTDTRWANHLYPVFLTESYVKSKYMSNEFFLQLF